MSDLLRWAILRKMLWGMTPADVERVYGIPAALACVWARGAER